jgi:hypothetical protein
LKITDLKKRAEMLEELPRHTKGILFVDEDFIIPGELFDLKNICIIPIDFINYDYTKTVVMPGEKQTA